MKVQNKKNLQIIGLESTQFFFTGGKTEIANERTC